MPSTHHALSLIQNTTSPSPRRPSLLHTVDRSSPQRPSLPHSLGTSSLASLLVMSGLTVVCAVRVRTAHKDGPRHLPSSATLHQTPTPHWGYAHSGQERVGGREAAA